MCDHDQPGPSNSGLKLPDDPVVDFWATAALSRDNKIRDCVRYRAQGCAFFRCGQVDSAMKDFDQAVKIHPDCAPYLWQRGIARYYNGKFEEASEQFALGQSVNANDTEEVIWEMLSCSAMLRSPAQASEAQAAAAVAPRPNLCFGAPPPVVSLPATGESALASPSGTYVLDEEDVLTEEDKALIKLAAEAAAKSEEERLAAEAAAFKSSVAHLGMLVERLRTVTEPRAVMKAVQLLFLRELPLSELLETLQGAEDNAALEGLLEKYLEKPSVLTEPFPQNVFYLGLYAALFEEMKGRPDSSMEILTAALSANYASEDFMLAVAQVHQQRRGA